MSAPPANPRHRRLQELREQVYAVAHRLGIDREGADKTIDRAGGPQEALRKLLDRERSRNQSIIRRHDRRVADEEAERRRQAFDAEREERDASRAAARAQRTLGQRLDHALAALAALPNAQAASLQPSVSHSKPSDQEPPYVEPIDVSPHLRLVEWHVEAIEHELDVAKGVTRPRVFRRMSGEEKDRFIVERFEGVHKDDVARDCPELGSVQVIERARRRHGRKAVDGLPREENGRLRAA